jgi:hypothetical protein
VQAIKGIYKNGQIELKRSANWPEGTEVVVKPVPHDETFGIREEDWSDTPEAIAEWLRWYDSLEPLIMTPEEEAEWQAARQAQKDFEKANFEKRSERIERLFS